MPSLINTIFRRNLVEPEIPICPDHKVEMQYRGKQGKPSRFSEQSEEEYTFIFFCPAHECNETATRQRVRTQVPVPGQSPARPGYARPGERNPL